MLGCPRFGARCPQPYACHHNSDLSDGYWGEKKTPPKFRGFLFFFFFGVCVWRWGNEGSQHLIKFKLLWLFRSYTWQRRKGTTLWNTHALQIMKPNRKQWVSTELEQWMSLQKGRTTGKIILRNCLLRLWGWPISSLQGAGHSSRSWCRSLEPKAAWRQTSFLFWEPQFVLLMSSTDLRRLTHTRKGHL